MIGARVARAALVAMTGRTDRLPPAWDSAAQFGVSPRPDALLGAVIAAWLRQTIQHRRAVLTHRLCSTHPDGRRLSDVPASHGTHDPAEHTGAR
jgi:hypothetical protein